MFHNFLMTMAPLKNDTNLRELSCNIYFKILFIHNGIDRAVIYMLPSLVAHDI